MSHNKKNNTNYPVVGSTPVEADINTTQKGSEFKVPVTKTTATGGTTFDHHDVIKKDKDQIVHKGDKQPTELHEPAAEKKYKLRDDNKEYEFKPRTEVTKTKDSKMKVWEEPLATKEHHYENIHEHGNLGNEHGIHKEEHVHIHEDREHRPVKDKIKDKIKERKDRKEHKDHATEIHGEHKAHEYKHEERVVRPEYEKTTEYTRVEGVKPEYEKTTEYTRTEGVRPGYERTEYTRTEGDRFKPEYERTEYTRTEGDTFKPDYERTEFTRNEAYPGYKETEIREKKELPQVYVGKGHVEIHDPLRPTEIHEPREEYKMKDDENIHVKFNINKT